MNLIHAAALTDTQKEETFALVKACREAEPLTLSAPQEDGLDYYLIYEDVSGNAEGLLVGFSFLFFVPQQDDGAEEDGLWTGEFTAFVHPQHRRHGYFTAMLNEALARADAYEREHSCQVDFCFLTDENSPAASAVLSAIGAEYWYSEYKMVRKLRENDRDYAPAVQIAADAGDSIPSSRLYTASLGGEIIGSCALLSSPGETYLYALRIREDLQGHGYGKDFLRGLLAMLAQNQYGGADADTAGSKGAVKDAGAATAGQTGAGQIGTAAAEQTDAAITEQAGAPGRTGTAGTAAAPEAVSVQVSGLNYIARNLYKKTGFRETETLSYYIY